MIGAAEISLGRLGAPGTKDYLTRQLSRPSRYWDSIRIGALVGLGKLEDPALVPLFDSYLDPKYVQEVRAAAVAGWTAAAPDDPKLAERLRVLTNDRNRQIRENAVERLGALHRESDIALLRELCDRPGSRPSPSSPARRSRRPKALRRSRASPPHPCPLPPVRGAVDLEGRVNRSLPLPRRERAGVRGALRP